MSKRKDMALFLFHLRRIAQGPDLPTISQMKEAGALAGVNIVIKGADDEQ